MTNLNAVIQRTAQDDFQALLTADAMQSLSYVDVFSVVFVDSEPIYFQGVRGMWIVYAKYASDMRTTEQIDAAIDSVLEKAAK